MLLLNNTNSLTHWIHTKLINSFGSTGAFTGEFILSGIAIILLVVIMAIIMIYMERKIAALMQLRLGPMRVGLWGSLQPFADVIKLLLKECLTPASADKFLFSLAPFIVLVVSFLALAPISFTPGLQLWNPNIGILYITSVSSIGVIGILMAGWSSNNKY